MIRRTKEDNLKNMLYGKYCQTVLPQQFGSIIQRYKIKVGVYEIQKGDEIRLFPPEFDHITGENERTVTKLKFPNETQEINDISYSTKLLRYSHYLDICISEFKQEIESNMIQIPLDSSKNEYIKGIYKEIIGIIEFNTNIIKDRFDSNFDNLPKTTKENFCVMEIQNEALSTLQRQITERHEINGEKAIIKKGSTPIKFEDRLTGIDVKKIQPILDRHIKAKPKKIAILIFALGLRPERGEKTELTESINNCFGTSFKRQTLDPHYTKCDDALKGNYDKVLLNEIEILKKEISTLLNPS